MSSQKKNGEMFIVTIVRVPRMLTLHLDGCLLNSTSPPILSFTAASTSIRTTGALVLLTLAVLALSDNSHALVKKRCSNGFVASVSDVTMRQATPFFIASTSPVHHPCSASSVPLTY